MAWTFFDVLDDVQFPHRWHLGDPFDLAGAQIDPRMFTAAKRTGILGPLKVAVDIPGAPMDFTFAAFDMPVLTKRAAGILEEFCKGGIERIPVVTGSSIEEYEICNVLTVVNCLDETRSIVMYWEDIDGRPDKVGRYRQVAEMKINHDLAKGFHVFRLGGWKIALIVSGDVKRVLEDEHVTGIKFREV